MILHWMSHPPELGRRYIESFQSLLKLPPEEAEKQWGWLMDQPPYQYGQICVFWKPLASFFRCYGWFSVMGVLLGFWQLRESQKRFPALCLLSVIFVHVLMINIGGNSVGRYAVPLEPLIWILLIGALPFPGLKSDMSG